MNSSDNEENISISREGLQKAHRGVMQEYYSTPGCEGLIQQLLHLLRFGEGLPIVQAGRQAGKTSMAGDLEKRLADCAWLTLVKCDTDQDIAELLAQITMDFGLEAGPGAGESLAALRHFSTQLANNRELAILILDDAHLLDSQGLGAVVSLLQGNNFPGYGLHMVFFSAPGLAERVDEIGLLDTPVYDFEVPLFSPSELSGFLKSKYPDAQSASFSGSEVQQVWSQSLGSPGVALRIFGKNIQDNPESAKVNLALIKTIPKGHIIALIVLVAVLLWAAFARNSGNVEEEIIVGRESVPVQLDEKLLNQVPEKPKLESVKTDEKKSEKLPVIELGQVEATKQVEAIAPKVDASPEKVAQQPVLPKAEPKVAPPAKVQRLAGPKGMTADELYLMDQAPDTFTLQIIAASRKDALVTYMDKQANKNDLYLYQALREGKVWFVVVTGIFTSRQEALQAVDGLPDNQKKGGPWPRQLSIIHGEIAANRSK